MQKLLCGTCVFDVILRCNYRRNNINFWNKLGRFWYYFYSVIASLPDNTGVHQMKRIFSAAGMCFTVSSLPGGWDGGSRRVQWTVKSQYYDIRHAQVDGKATAV